MLNGREQKAACSRITTPRTTEGKCARVKMVKTYKLIEYTGQYGFPTMECRNLQTTDKKEPDGNGVSGRVKRLSKKRLRAISGYGGGGLRNKEAPMGGGGSGLGRGGKKKN